MINNDPRMKVTLRQYFAGKIPVEKMSPDQRASLKKLQDYERAVAIKAFKLQDELLGPIEEKIQQELFSRKVE